VESAKKVMKKDNRLIIIGEARARLGVRMEKS
jgi:hypothetical protein